MTVFWLTFVSVFAPAQREVIDRVAAVIEDDIITLRELEKKADPFFAQLSDIQEEAAREQRRAQILREVLDIEIGERIVNAEIEKSRDRLAVTEADVDKTVEDVMRMNRLTREQLEAAIYAQGMSWSEFRAKLRGQVERTKLIQARVQGKIQIRDSEVEQRCELRQKGEKREARVCASHILRKIPEGADAATVEKVRVRVSQLQAEVSAGADFAAFALKHSDDKNAPGGDLGCFSRGEMVSAIEEAAYKLEVGQVSEVIRSPFGFHVVKVTDRKQGSAVDCSDPNVLVNFKNEIYQEEMERHMAEWLDELRRKAFVEVRL